MGGICVNVDLRSNWFGPSRLVLILGFASLVGVLNVKLSDWGVVTWFESADVGNVGEWIGGLAAGAAILAIGHQQALERWQRREDEMANALAHGKFLMATVEDYRGWIARVIRTFDVATHESIVDTAYELNRYLNQIRLKGDFIASGDLDRMAPYRNLIHDSGTEPDAAAQNRVDEWRKMRGVLQPVQ